jgi:hypothetical protein
LQGISADKPLNAEAGDPHGIATDINNIGENSAELGNGVPWTYSIRRSISGFPTRMWDELDFGDDWDWGIGLNNCFSLIGGSFGGRTSPCDFVSHVLQLPEEQSGLHDSHEEKHKSEPSKPTRIVRDPLRFRRPAFHRLSLSLCGRARPCRPALWHLERGEFLSRKVFGRCRVGRLRVVVRLVCLGVVALILPVNQMRTPISLMQPLGSEASCALNRRSENVIVKAVIIAELKLSNIEVKIPFADVVEGADDAALEDAPKALNRIQVRVHRPHREDLMTQ